MCLFEPHAPEYCPECGSPMNLRPYVTWRYIPWEYQFTNMDTADSPPLAIRENWSWNITTDTATADAK